MTKNNKILAILSTSALLALGTSIISFAATNGWVQSNGDWYYTNRNGEYETNVWRDNASKTYKFYLGDNGKMLTSELIEDNGNYYYVNGDGVQIRNSWVSLFDESDNENRWYYFDNNGKAYENGWKEINGKRYHFTDFKMDYSWLNEDGEMLDTDTEDIWKEATYYVGDNGERHDNQWVSVEEFDQDEYENRDILWVWFGSNGKKVVDSTKTINGVKYSFDEAGAMVSEWYGSATPSEASYKYYNEDGSMAKGRWFKAVPSEEQNSEDHDDDVERWFYANSNGTLVKDTIKTINGKKYIFDEYGIMHTGLVVVDSNKKVVEVLGNKEDGMPTSDAVKSAFRTGDLMYFDESGAMKTGKVTLELDDETYTFKFGSNGKALDGVKDDYLYENGILIKADKDNKYEVVTVREKEYLVNTSGKVMKSGTYKDSDDNKWVVTKDDNGDYSITKE